MIPFIGPDFHVILHEGGSNSENPLGMPIARGFRHDYDEPESSFPNGDECSDRHIRSAIRYLDPERHGQNGGGPIVVPVIAASLTWIIVLAALLSFVI